MKWKTHLAIANGIISLLNIDYKYRKIFKDSIIEPDKHINRGFSHHKQSKFIAFILCLRSKYYFNKNDFTTGYKYLGEALHLAQDYAIGYGSYESHYRNEEMLASSEIDKSFKYDLNKVLPKKFGFFTFLKYFRKLTGGGLFFFVFNKKKWLQKKFDFIFLNSLILTYIIQHNTKNIKKKLLSFFFLIIFIFLAFLSIYFKYYITFIFFLILIYYLILILVWYF